MRCLLAAALLVLTAAQAQAADPLDATIAALEAKLGARIGVAVHDTASGRDWRHRADERFLMNSTVKVPVCGAILSGVDAGQVSLDEALPIKAADILEYAPVTRDQVGGTMTVADLCLASIDQSDNTAANLLIDRVGGPAGVTAFFRTLGDDVSRLDRMEPELNRLAVGDERDTSTPAAMIADLEAMLTGDVLSDSAQKKLADWMRPGAVTGALLRPSVPEGWDVSDKSGAGANTRNILAMLNPPDGAPVFVAIYLSDTDADLATRNAAVAEVGAVLMQAVLDGRS